MSHSRVIALALVALAAVPAAAQPPAPALRTLSQLEQAARARVDATARVPLAVPADLPSEPGLRLFGPDAPSAVKAMSLVPEGGRPFADMIRASLFEGHVATTTRAAMALRVAQIVDSPYVAAHAVRALAGSPESRTWKAFFTSGTPTGLSPRQRLAVDYADALTRDVQGITDDRFTEIRAHFTDGEIVELTIVVAFFNHLARFAETLRLPVEPWALQPPATPLPYVTEQTGAPRVALISDAEIAATTAAAAAARDAAVQKAGLGLGMANSMRAMLRAPGLAIPWRTLMSTLREGEQVGRDVKLQVSLAVSTMNGCRYCVRHQVLGLRRIGVDPARLVALQKDDSVLTPRERAAVVFARQVTSAPSQVTDADWKALTATFGDRGALEVLLQTCTFAFMNRFTDNLKLPSEDEAVKVYQETYGSR